MEEKLERLKAATEQAKTDLDCCERALAEAKQKVLTAKLLLKELDEEEQQRIKVNETKLPELLEEELHAQDAYDTAVKRYETNQRYLAVIAAKVQS